MGRGRYLRPPGSTLPERLNGLRTERLEADIRRTLTPVTVDTHLEPLGDPAAMSDHDLHRHEPQ